MLALAEPREHRALFSLVFTRVKPRRILLFSALRHSFIYQAISTVQADRRH